MTRLLNTRPCSALPAVLAAVVLTACNLAPQHTTPPLSVPDTLTPGAGTPVVATETALQWAQAQHWIAHPALREVVALALTHNRDLRVALENIEKARAQYGISRADRLPSITAQAQATRSRTSADLSNSGQSSVSTQYAAQLGFTSYEIDFWGRIRNLNEAALQSFLQSEAQQRNIQIALVADVSNAWLTLAADLARLQRAQQTLASRERAAAMTERMLEIGSTSGLVVAQNRSTVETAHGDVAAYTAQVERSRNALQLLTGGPLRADLLPQAGLWLQPPSSTVTLRPVPEQLASSVLLQRPDVQAAEANLRAMNANIGAARAALFPTIALTASVGTGSRALDGLLGNGTGTWSFMPQIRLPIFDGRRNQANVAVAESSQRIAIAQYEKAVQTAFREVADALADRRQWQERLQAQQRMVEATQQALTLSEARFQAGVDNYLSVLDAQRSLYAAQQTLITLQLGEQVNRVALWKTLGGQEAVQP